MYLDCAKMFYQQILQFGVRVGNCYLIYHNITKETPIYGLYRYVPQLG